METQWSLVLFTVLTGAAGWTLGCVAVDEFIRKTKNDTNFVAAIVAIVMAALGGIASVTHLSHPENMLAALNHPTSGIFTEALLVGLTALFALVYLVVLKRAAGDAARKIFAVLAALFGIVLAFAAGASYMMAAQLMWNTPLLPLAYGGTAMPLGVAVYLLIAQARGEQELKTFQLLLMVGGAVAAITGLFYGMATGAAAHEPLLLWGLVVIIGGVAPALCGWFASKQPASALVLYVVATVAAFIGCAALRCVMWATSTVVNNFFGML